MYPTKTIVAFHAFLLQSLHTSAPADRRAKHFRYARRCKREPPQSGQAVAIAYQDVWTVTICFQKTVL